MTQNLFPNGTVLVVGGSGGLGAAIAQQFAIDGSDVAITYNSNEAAGKAVAQDIAAKGRKASVHQLNAADLKGIERVIAEVIAQHGRIHTLVFSAAGVAHQLHISEFTDELWNEHINAEVTGFYKLCRGLLPHFKAQGGGSIVHIGSGGHLIWPARDGLSVIPKSANEALIRGIASEEGQFNIRANSVLVGVIEAGMFLKLKAQGVFTPEWEAMVKAMLPMRRFGKGEDIANAAVFLASNKANYITGQTLAVAGGFGV